MRHERSWGQANYFLVEKCLLFDLPIPKVAGILLSSAGGGGGCSAPIRALLIGACCFGPGSGVATVSDDICNLSLVNFVICLFALFLWRKVMCLLHLWHMSFCICYTDSFSPRSPDTKKILTLSSVKATICD